MKCNSCGFELPENAKFCHECGTKAEREVVCGSCGTKAPAGYKFCMECGSPLSGGSGKEENGWSEEDVWDWDIDGDIFQTELEKCPEDAAKEKDEQKTSLTAAGGKNGNCVETADVRERIIEKAKAENLNILEPAEGVLGVKELLYPGDDQLFLFDIREQATAKAMEQTMTSEQISLGELLQHYEYYLSSAIPQCEGHYVRLYRPVWIGADMARNTIFCIKESYERYEFYKCSFGACGDDGDKMEEWMNVEFLKGKADAVRIYASLYSGRDPGVSDQHYLFDETGKVLWKADRPVRPSGYHREIGHEFHCNPDWKQDSAMLVDFYTGRVLLKDYYAIINYREKGSNRLVLDGVSRIGNDIAVERYSHKLFYYDDGRISEFTEQEYKVTAEMDGRDLLLPGQKYVAGNGTRSEFKRMSPYEAKKAEVFAEELWK